MTVGGKLGCVVIGFVDGLLDYGNDLFSLLSDRIKLLVNILFELYHLGLHYIEEYFCGIILNLLVHTAAVATIIVNLLLLLLKNRILYGSIIYPLLLRHHLHAILIVLQWINNGIILIITYWVVLLLRCSHHISQQQLNLVNQWIRLVRHLWIQLELIPLVHSKPRSNMEIIVRAYLGLIQV